MDSTKRIMRKQDVAQLFFPEISPKSASAALRRTISGDPRLRSMLDSVNYKPLNKTLTIRQIEVLIKELGNPFDEDGFDTSYDRYDR